MRRWGPIAVGLLLALGGLVLALTGHEPPPYERAVTAAEDVTSYRSESQSLIRPPAGSVPERYVWTTQGSYDVTGGRAATTITWVEPVELKQAGDFETVVDVSTGNFIYYLKTPGSKPPWKKLDATSVLKNESIDLTRFLQVASAPPLAIVDLLRSADKDTLLSLGTKDIRGIQTHGYTVTVDLRVYREEVLKNGPTPTQAVLARLIELTGVALTDVDFWIDTDGMVRRMTIAYTQQIPGQGRTDFGTTFDLFDLNTPVQVVLPPADQVTELKAA